MDKFDSNNIPADVLQLMRQYANDLRNGGGEGGSSATAHMFRVQVQQRGHSHQYAEEAEKYVSQPIVEDWYRQYRYR